LSSNVAKKNLSLAFISSYWMLLSSRNLVQYQLSNVLFFVVVIRHSTVKHVPFFKATELCGALAEDGSFTCYLRLLGQRPK